MEFQRPRIMPRIMTSPQPRQIPIRPRVTDTRIVELLKKKQEEKQKEREGLLKTFTKEETGKPKEESKEKKEELKEQHEKPKEPRKIVKRAKRKPVPKKPKEDVFIKLQELAKESKKKGNKQK